MKRKYLPKQKTNIETVRGAYDNDGKFWHEEDINNFTGGIITMCFGITREKIKIIEVEKRKLINQKQ